MSVRVTDLGAGGLSLTEKPKAIWVASRHSYIERVLTLVHEFVHILHPDWPERQVADDERRIVTSLQLPRNLTSWDGDSGDDFGLRRRENKLEYRDAPGDVPLFMQELGVRRFWLASIPFDGWWQKGKEIGSLLVNEKLSGLLRIVTFVHELIHVMKPHWSEEQVLEDERRIAQMLGIPTRRLEQQP